jgi:hypothetical protein
MQIEATGGQVGLPWCSAESDSFSVPERSDVVYGSDGMFTYLVNRTGSISLNVNTLGCNSNSTGLKGGFYRPISVIIPPAGYTRRSSEGESCG